MVPFIPTLLIIPVLSLNEFLHVSTKFRGYEDRCGLFLSVDEEIVGISLPLHKKRVPLIRSLQNPHSCRLRLLPSRLQNLFPFNNVMSIEVLPQLMSRGENGQGPMIGTSHM